MHNIIPLTIYGRDESEPASMNNRAHTAANIMVTTVNIIPLFA